MDAAEHCEHHPEDKGHGHGQQRGQQPVKDELDQLEGGVASYPHPVEAVRGRGLRDHVFKTNLSGPPSHAETKKDIISADTHDGGGMWARTEAATSRYSGAKCYTRGKKQGHVKWCTQMVRAASRHRVVFTFEEQFRKVTFKCAWMSRGSRSGAGEYSPAFFARMGSIDLVNSSSSIIMLDSSFSFSRPMLFSQTEPAESWGPCTLLRARCAERHPSPYGDRADATGSQPLPRTISLMTDATGQLISPPSKASGANATSICASIWVNLHFIQMFQ